jgi:hypothetical protein
MYPVMLLLAFISFVYSEKKILIAYNTFNGFNYSFIILYYDRGSEKIAYDLRTQLDANAAVYILS